MVKFKILPKVDGFRDAKGFLHKPGDIVDLPPSYDGETWLERIKPAKQPKPMRKVKPSEVKPVPLGKSKKSKS